MSEAGPVAGVTSGPAGRIPGKWVVLSLLLFGALFLGFMILMATKLDPAADRFHRGYRSTQKAG